MQAILETVSNLLPYHLLSYGALLGTELFQSFVNTKICYQALPMKEFLALQKRVFPAYFRCQVGLVVLTAVTRPPYSILSFSQHIWDSVPLIAVGVTGALNCAMNEDNSSTTDPAKIQQANKTFSRNHAMSIHLNAIALVATVWYGFTLSSSLLNGL
ncbi:hypothetical protein KXV68_005005 [Aspergillus fumigatus]|uniref:Xanthocillin biosynthesis cluster protein D n=2 Tax=Aspergillus fumigatus TaxID=746128 RepID=XAND_ASPFU|nr:hypothetical protein AFUA_5G02650 [Aspergillus fumigatus Af293]A4DA06.1 RecName: Full=Xanthocillin biosynthesis cluster protein D [Aspergillus fumigatus Af293]KAH1344878.1 hypothetical protein KXX67_002378 [Aspergillus fumigatus]EBA27256.1 hypothetical protein AFUA_5G02650 [Aspergillus fumigatus Af293]KAH1434275.1 hypothetical protein KXX32_000551 [Aspergillus fumigatus]KAH1498480.1 hypothetical protein KXX42_000655 [Aspergillus fumigatus]KAH1532950.1 hypothetical protein KXX18_005094 [Asp